MFVEFNDGVDLVILDTTQIESICSPENSERVCVNFKSGDNMLLINNAQNQKKIEELFQLLKGVSHIDQYQKGFEDGRVSVLFPLQSLLLSLADATSLKTFRKAIYEFINK